MENKKIKLLVCYHKPDVLLKDEILTPIHVGRSLALSKNEKEDKNLNWMLENMIGDDTGENISNKNGSYNELTGLYWAWKNYDELGNPDFIGLMHYRRHFIFEENEKHYFETDKIDDNYFSKINYSEEIVQHLFDDCDFVYHKGKVDNIYKHYADNHKIQDLDIALKIIDKMYPEYSSSASKYIKNSFGCFCNMFIFPKKIFFDYCEWLFNILSEFEKQVDISEKRLFISERLTGIYIQKLMKDGFKAKILPMCFVKENVNIPIAIPYQEKNEFSVAVSILSIFENNLEGTNITINLLCENEISSETKNAFEVIEKKYDDCKINFLDVKKILNESKIDCSKLNFPQHYPLILSLLFPEQKKCVYFDDSIIILKDLSEFYRTCSVDDFWVVGLPQSDNNSFSLNKQIGNFAFVLNLEKLRKHKFFENLDFSIKKLDAAEVFNKSCSNEIGYFPYWFYTLASSESDVFQSNLLSRVEVQKRTKLRPVLCYDLLENKPHLNIQGVYSIFWWNIAKIVPAQIKFNLNDIDKQLDILKKQQKKIEQRATNNAKKNCKLKNKIQMIHCNRKKAFDYLKKNGIKSTLRKIFINLKNKEIK